MRNSLSVTQSNGVCDSKSEKFRGLHCWSFIGTIIRRESHWQSRFLRNDLH